MISNIFSMLFFVFLVLQKKIYEYHDLIKKTDFNYVVILIIAMFN